MKRHNSIFMAAVLPLVLAVLFASCENLVNPPSGETGKASVSITVSDAMARTVLPELNTNELTYTLKGTLDGGGEQQLAEFSGSGTTLALDEGDWTFTLTALKGEDIVLTGDAPPITLKGDESARVDFTLKPLKTGTGAINISFTYPADSGVTSVKTGGDITTETIDLSSANGAWNYRNDEIEPDDYFVTFTFYRGGEVAAVVSEIIQVRSGLTSKKTIALTVKEESNALGNYWKQGNIEEGGEGEQWFTFTASDAPYQYVHVKFGGLDDLYVQVFKSKEDEVGSPENLYNTTTSMSISDLDLIAGETYYIKVTPYDSGDFGDYKIMVNEFAIPELPEETTALEPGWNPGNIETAGAEDWFSFTRSAELRYLHIKFGTLKSVYVQVFDNDWRMVVSRENLYGGSTGYINISGLSAGETYYIRVWPYNSGGSGDYEIMVNESAMPELPEETTELVSGWYPGNIEAGGEEWFTFTASDAPDQYVHVKFGELYDLNVEVFNSAKQEVVSRENLYDDTTYISISGLSAGETYYIKVTPYRSDFAGDYQIMVNESFITELPEEITELVSGWYPGNIEAGGEEWFKFTASDDPMWYLHVKFDGLRDLYVQVFNSALWQIVRPTNLYDDTTSIGISVSVGETYYIRVTPYGSGSGDYEIAVSDSSTTP